MSKLNGDKARFARETRKKALRRAATRELLKGSKGKAAAGAAAPAAKAK